MKLKFNNNLFSSFKKIEKTASIIFFYILTINISSIASVNHYVKHISVNGNFPFMVQYEHGTDTICRSFMHDDKKLTFSHKLNFAYYFTNCTIILGSLQIGPLYINEETESLINTVTFPRLRIITGSLLVHNFQKLGTLQYLFPNLRIIEGDGLIIMNFALIITENPHLKNIGLTNLMEIKNGTYAFIENPQLCYINEIDWNYILKEKNTIPVVTENKVDNCPNFCSMNCTREQITKKSYCWNENACQNKINCSISCKSGFCDKNKNCCHQECYGGCYKPNNATQCFACKHVNVFGKCMERCPPDYHLLMENRFCVTESMCREVYGDSNKKNHLKSLNGHKNIAIMFQNKCLPECPKNFELASNFTCIECGTECLVVGNFVTVSSKADLKMLKEKGYTKIDTLDISFTDNYTDKEVNELMVTVFGKLKTIRALYIMRTPAIKTLSIFSNLKFINGKVNDNFIIRISENPNLVDMDLPKVTLAPGNIAIFKNPLLCPDKIKEFYKKHNLSLDKLNQAELNSNGVGSLCNVHYFDISLSPRKRMILIDGANVSDIWIGYNNSIRTYLGFTVFYRETKSIDSLDYYLSSSCQESLWKSLVLWQDIDSEKLKNISAFILALKPYTLYGVYIQTLSLDVMGLTLLSKIEYTRTLADTPDKVINLKVDVLPNNALHVTWDDPENPHGIITQYNLIYEKQDEDYSNKYDHIDICKIIKNGNNNDEKFNKNEIKTTVSPNHECECTGDVKDQNAIAESIKKRKLTHTIRAIHVFILSTVFGKSDNSINEYKINRSANNRILTTNIPKTTKFFYNFEKYKNYTQPIPVKITPETILSTTREIENPKKPSSTVSSSILETVVFDKNYNISNLDHYTTYTIKVVACHAYSVSERKQLCSDATLISATTSRNPDADSINESSITYKRNDKSILISWDMPKQPNGYILFFNIQLSNVKSGAGTTPCVSIGEYKTNKNKYEITKFDFRDKTEYRFRIQAVSLAGQSNWSEYHYFYYYSNETPLLEILLGILVSIVILIFAVIAGCFIYIKKYRKTPIDMLLYASINPDYHHMEACMYVADEWEVEKSKISMMDALGEGNFGKVYRGTVKGLRDGEPNAIHDCAVKILSENATSRERIEFLNEASVMKGLHCHHVVRLLGVMSQGSPIVLMELMLNGDLKNFLRKHRPDDDENCGRQPPCLSQLLQWIGEIADGMSYLSDHKFVHRDLAARNCMVSGDLTSKIGDFGMCRDIYEMDYYRKGNKGILPVRWMAPESLKDGKFTSESDIFSFGVVLWEMATLAEQPYQGLSNDQVLNFVKAGNLMEKPDGCPDIIYNLMMRCWKYKSKQRPTFLKIVEELLPHLNKNFEHVSYYFKRDADVSDLAGGGDVNNEETEFCQKQAADETGTGDYDIDDSRTPLTYSPSGNLQIPTVPQSHIDSDTDSNSSTSNLNVCLSKKNNGTNLANGHLGNTVS